jgi:hypothetical protein
MLRVDTSAKGDGIRSDRLRAGIANLHSELPGLAAGFQRVSGNSFGNLHELINRLAQGCHRFRGIAWLWRDFEDVDCFHLRETNRQTAEVLAGWPVRAQELLLAEEEAEQQADHRLKEEFRLIAEEEVEAELTPAVIPPGPAKELATPGAPAAQPVDTPQHSQAVTLPMAEEKSPEEDAHERAQNDLEVFREEATGDPKRPIPQKSRRVRFVVAGVGLSLFTFGELVFGVSISTATMAVAFSVALLIIVVFNALDLIIAEPLNRVLSYWTARLRIRRRGSKAIPQRPEGEIYVVAFGGLALLLSALALMLFLRKQIVDSTALLGGNAIGLWIMAIAVLVTLLAEMAFSPAYAPEVYTGEAHRLAEVERLDTIAKAVRTERIERERHSQQEIERERREQRHLEREAEQQARERAAARHYANTREGRQERREEAARRRDQTISESRVPFDEERNAIQSMVLRRKLLLPPYRAAALQLEADVLKLCNALVKLIQARDPQSGLKSRVDEMDAIYRYILDVLREECPLHLDGNSEDLLIPVLVPEADGRFVRIDSNVRRLDHAIVAFENRSRPVRAIRFDCYSLYQELRAEVRQHVLDRHFAIASVQYNLGIGPLDPLAARFGSGPGTLRRPTSDLALHPATDTRADALEGAPLELPPDDCVNRMAEPSPASGGNHANAVARIEPGE